MDQFNHVIGLVNNFVTFGLRFIPLRKLGVAYKSLFAKDESKEKGDYSTPKTRTIFQINSFQLLVAVYNLVSSGLNHNSCEGVRMRLCRNDKLYPSSI